MGQHEGLRKMGLTWPPTQLNNVGLRNKCDWLIGRDLHRSAQRIAINPNVMRHSNDKRYPTTAPLQHQQ
jgi:hypothetical protein